MKQIPYPEFKQVALKVIGEIEESKETYLAENFSLSPEFCYKNNRCKAQL